MMFFLSLPQNIISQNCLHLTPQVDKIILNERLNAKIILMRELAKYKLEKLNQNLLLEQIGITVVLLYTSLIIFVF